MCELVIQTAINNGDYKKMSNKDNYEQLENFLVKVSEMYQYNLENYPEEKPTMIGAFNEILDEIKNNR
jgi:hypothetical protein